MDAHEIQRMQRVDTPMGPATVQVAPVANSAGKVNVWLDSRPKGVVDWAQDFDACDVHSRAHARHDNDDGSTGIVARMVREVRADALPFFNGSPL